MNWSQLLEARIDAIGENASDEQADALVSWIVEHVPRDYWESAALSAIDVPGVYTEISMRLGEG